MAQFDVHENPGRYRQTVPYVLVLQNARFDRIPTRLVAALVLAEPRLSDEHDLAPRFQVEGRQVVMDFFELATIPAGRLGPVTATLTDDVSRTRITRALDALLSQA